MKFGRRYRLTIDMNDGSGAIIVEMPFTIQFSIERTAQATLNTMALRVFNLGLANRNRIRQDFYNYDPRHKVKLEAGYDSLFTIFDGMIMQADSSREGPDVVTTIIAQDGGSDVANTQINKTLAVGATIRDVFREIVGEFPNLTLGAIGNFDGKFNRSIILEGNAYEVAKQYAPLQVFIDKGKVFFLKNNEVISGEIPVINSSTGLLQTPLREGSFLTIKTLFEPRVTVGQIVDLASDIEPIYDGQYKVAGVHHQGTMSNAVCGDLYSKFNLLLSQPFGALTIVQNEQTTKPAGAQ